MSRNKVTVLDFAQKKKRGEKISVLTAHDYPTGKLVDASGVDAVLVGDSLGMVVLGYESTASVTMDDMIHHSKAVRKGVERAFLMVDMPFMSYQASDADAVREAGRFVKEAGCQAVKLEGGSEMVPRVRAIIDAGIPVVGHIGLTPQSINKLGGYRVQGKEEDDARRILEDALALEKAGCFALVLECLPKELSRKVTEALEIPTIGIGAGKYCDGQVLVTYDVIGLFDKFVPKFVKQYAKLNEEVINALQSFRSETESGIYPDDEHSF